MQGMHRNSTTEHAIFKWHPRDVSHYIKAFVSQAVAGFLQSDQRNIHAHPVLVVFRICQVGRPLHRARARIEEIFTFPDDVPVDPQMAAFDVFSGNRPQILIDGVLIQFIADPLPTDLVVKILHLVRA